MKIVSRTNKSLDIVVTNEVIISFQNSILSFEYIANKKYNQRIGFDEIFCIYAINKENEINKYTPVEFQEISLTKLNTITSIEIIFK